MAIPVLPAPLGLVLWPLPLTPLRLALQRAVDLTAARHTGLFARLDHHADKAFVIDPVDLPFLFCLRPRRHGPTIEVLRRGTTVAGHARIAGPVAALVGMVHGAFDGDALFFSRDIGIEGDTEAVLALRNALDDAELDLAQEAAAAFGPLAPAISRLLDAVLPAAGRLTGVALTRMG